MINDDIIDIKENTILEISPDLLDILLIDHTTKKNIFWATNDYTSLGKGYSYFDYITSDNITGKNGYVVRPRILKSRENQESRCKDMAEVYTPTWVCNAQNNLIDSAWFGRDVVFNRECISEDGVHYWETKKERIEFSIDKDWKSYIRDTRLEISCGEAPYIVSRYDATTGKLIEIEERIGILDRKLRVISENVDNSTDWLKWAQIALMNTYGYEWQGDSLLLARENVLYSFIDYFQLKFNRKPKLNSLKYAAYIISWNLWQMDGLKMVVPNSCENVYSENIFGEKEKIKCLACENDSITGHIGTMCMIRDWRKKKDKQQISFASMFNSVE